MKMIRYSNDDLIEALRLKDVFDISTVQYAYIETNGSVSVQLKKEYQPVNVSESKIKAPQEALPCLVISDGKIVSKEFELCSMSSEKLEKILRKNNLSVKDVFLMTADKSGKTHIVRKGDA